MSKFDCTKVQSVASNWIDTNSTKRSKITGNCENRTRDLSQSQQNKLSAKPAETPEGRIIPLDQIPCIAHLGQLLYLNFLPLRGRCTERLAFAETVECSTKLAGMRRYIRII